MVELFFFKYFFSLKKKLDTKIIKKKTSNVLVLQETTEAPHGRISAALATETDNLDPGSNLEVTEDKKAAELSERSILSEYMQLMKNSGYEANLKKEVLLAGMAGYRKILEADRAGTKPMYRSQEWRLSAQGMEDREKSKSKRWLGGEYKSYTFVPHTPGSELKKLKQAKEEEMRPGGRETFHIKIIESAGYPLERILGNADPFDGNKCED